MWLKPSRAGASSWLRQRQASKQHRVEAAAVPVSSFQELPDGVAAQGLQTHNAGFAPFAAFDQGLHRFEGVKVVTVRVADADGDDLGHFCAERHFDRGQSPGDRHTRAGRQRKGHLAGRVDHLLREVPAPGEVLVVEDRHAAATLAKDLHGFVEELVARVERLALFVDGVVAVLANDDHSIDGQLVAAEAQRLANRGVELEVVEAAPRVRGSGRPRAAGRCTARRGRRSDDSGHLPSRSLRGSGRRSPRRASCGGTRCRERRSWAACCCSPLVQRRGCSLAPRRGRVRWLARRRADRGE